MPAILSGVALLIAALTVCIPGAIAQDVEPFELQGGWWEQPAERTRFATLVCSFDDDRAADADYARGMSASGGFGMNCNVEGRHRNGVEIAEMGGHLHFAGGSNFPLHRGTMRMMVRGEVWGDDTPRWLFEARAADRMGVRLERGKLSLVFSPGRRVDQVISQLDLDLDESPSNAWHSVVASWDRYSGRGWIALDGRGVTGKMEFSEDPRAAFAIYLGGGFGSHAGSINGPGLIIDDFVIYDVALPVLDAPAVSLPEDHDQFLERAEEGLRRTLDFLCDLQRWGGWQTIYSWPTLLGSSAQGREWVDFEDYIDNDKGNGSARVAAMLLYGYQVLGDYRYLDSALRTGEFLLAAQDERGFWLHGYRMTVSGIVPTGDATRIKFQDQVQAHPIQFLSALHRLTGDQRYIDAIMRAGDFYIAAQNPNGSWSHHFNAELGIGQTAIGHPQGGELNDEAMNDAIDMMAFFYHLTGEPRFIAALRRAGDWLIDAQGSDIPMWADQYDAADRPAWARHFEPPAYGTSATISAAHALVEMYRFSGDERYLDPIRHAVVWMEEHLDDGRVFHYTEPGTGRPVAAWQQDIYYLDDPDAFAYLQTQPIGVWYLRQVDILSRLQTILRTAQTVRPSPHDMSVEMARGALESLRTEALSSLEAQNEAGIWVDPVVAGFMGSLGAGFFSVVPRASPVLRYVERARIVRGEIQPVFRGNGVLKQMAFPEPGWYDIDWAEHAG